MDVSKPYYGALPPLPPDLPVGWTISLHDSYGYLLHAESALPYLAKYLDLDQLAVTNLLLYIAANIDSILTSASFLQSPVYVLQTVLDYPHLSIEEDKLLLHVLRYAGSRAGINCDNPEFWSAAEISSVSPTLSLLLPRLAILSISPASCVQFVEPLGLVPAAVLARKYKYDAFRAESISCGKSERDMVCERYGGSTICAKASDMLWARAPAVISESSHPYDVGVDEELECIALAGWAGHAAVEFDPRSCVGLEARLSFYADESGRMLLGEWKHLWRNGGATPSGRKFWVLPGNKFWVGFKCPRQATPRWGWKLRAYPLVDEGEFA
jgi:hypothetical protein